MKSNTPSARVSWPDFAASTISLGLLALWLGPYFWPTSNNYQEVQPILALLDRQVFARDFTVQSYLQHTPREFYQWLVAALVRTGLSLPAAHFVLQFGTMLFAAATFIRAALWMTARDDERTHPLLLGAVLLLWATSASHRGWDLPLLDPSDPVPSAFATGIVLCGWYFGLRRNWLLAYGLFGAAALLQFLVGFMPGLLLAGVALSDVREHRGGLPRLLGGIAAWGVLLGIVAIPMMLAARHEPPVASAEIIRIFGTVRAPHHWRPSAAGVFGWANHLVVFGAGIVLAMQLPRDGAGGRIRKVALYVIPVTAALLLVNYLFVEVFPLAFAGKLQFQRALPFSLLAILYVCGWLWHDALVRGRGGLALALVLAPLVGAQGGALALCAGAYLVPLWRRGIPIPMLDVGVATAVVALGSLPYPLNFFARPAAFAALLIVPLVMLVRSETAHARRGILTWSGVLAFAAVTAIAMSVNRDATSGVRRQVLRFAPAYLDWSVAPPDVRHLAAVVARSTPDSALVLLPPFRSFAAFPLLARRSVVFTMKNMPFTDAGMMEWDRRLGDLVGHRLDEFPRDTTLTNAWRDHSAQYLHELASKYSADYIVSRDEWHPNLGAQRVDSVDGWTLWRASAVR